MQSYGLSSQNLVEVICFQILLLDDKVHQQKAASPQSGALAEKNNVKHWEQNTFLAT